MPDKISCDLIFFHGLESGPQGTKAQWFRAHYNAHIPGLPTGDFPACLELARETLAQYQPKVVVGSSFGGALTQVLLGEGTWTGKTLLIAPAGIKLCVSLGSPRAEKLIILHGDQDNVIPVKDSLAYINQFGAATHASLHILEGGDHRLNSTLEDGTLAYHLSQLLS